MICCHLVFDIITIECMGEGCFELGPWYAEDKQKRLRFLIC